MATSLSEITAAILVGGQGTRLRAVLPDKQKVMAPVTGRPFVQFLLDQLANAGMRAAVLCTGHQAGQVREHFGASYRGLRVRYSQETTPLGTAGALRLALPLFESDPVLVMNGDSYCGADLNAFWAWHQQAGAAGSLVTIEQPDATQRGRIEIDAQGAVTRFVEKDAAQGKGWINAGIYLLSRQLLETIPTGRAVSIEREMFPSWCGHGLFAFKTSAKFLDIGTPAAYALAEQFFGASQS